MRNRWKWKGIVLMAVAMCCGQSSVGLAQAVKSTEVESTEVESTEIESTEVVVSEAMESEGMDSTATQRFMAAETFAIAPVPLVPVPLAPVPLVPVPITPVPLAPVPLASPAFAPASAFNISQELKPRELRPGAVRSGLPIGLESSLSVAQSAPAGSSAYPASELELAQEAAEPAPAEALDLDPDIYDNSPVLQEWYRNSPDIAAEIRHDPSFQTRLHLRYVQFPSTDQASGISVGLNDVFIGQTRFTASVDYEAAFERDRASYGADVHYFLRPLGRYINVAPLVGYRHLETEHYTEAGVNLGVRLMLALSRTGAADISLTQSWVDPGSRDEVGLTSLSVGYAVTNDLRLSAQIKKQNARQGRDSLVGIGLEWLL